MKISFKTLGCRLNQHETDALVSEFYENGYEIVEFKEKSDITVINTCTVTSQSDHKSRNIIQQAIKANPNTRIVVTGCMAEQYKNEIAQIKGVSLVVTNAQKNNIFQLIQAQEIQKYTPNQVFAYKPVSKSLHTRAAIKIQDGCDNYCTFCIIPSVRGRALSRPVVDIIENIKLIIQNGFKEIVITGVNIGRYDYNNTNFVGLLKKILEIPGDFRIRISSLEPDGFGTELVDLFKNPKLMHHLHLCLQSGSNHILLKMRRMYQIEQFNNLVGSIRATYPNFNITTDIITGFPGETNSHFNETLNIINSLKFSHIHTFKYSVRSGTVAERLPNQVSERVKTMRSEKIREMAQLNKRDYYNTFINKTERVLVEKQLGDNWYYGYGEHYIPIVFQHPNITKNEFVTILITGFSNQQELTLEGIVAESKILVKPKNKINLQTV